VTVTMMSISHMSLTVSRMRLCNEPLNVQSCVGLRAALVSTFLKLQGREIATVILW
jgi:hypothetical protein